MTENKHRLLEEMASLREKIFHMNSKDEFGDPNEFLAQHELQMALLKLSIAMRANDLMRHLPALMQPVRSGVTAGETA